MGDEVLPVAQVEFEVEPGDEPAAPQALGHPGCAGEGLHKVGALSGELVCQGTERGVPEGDVGASDQAVNDLADPDSPLVLGNHVQEPEAASLGRRCRAIPSPTSPDEGIGGSD